MKNKLFSEFSEVSAKAWKQKIQVDLKGKDYNNTLVWNSPEGIHVKPFYHKDDLANIHSLQTNSSRWKIGQEIYVANARAANRKAIDISSRGAESILFIIPEDTIAVEELVKDLDFDKISVFFQLQFLSISFTSQLLDTLKNNPFILLLDPIGKLASSGNWYQNLEKDFTNLREILKLHKQVELSIDLGVYQNAGANMVQQLAYSLAHANEYLNYCFKEASEEIKCLKINFKVSIGGNYFFEIAKLKALRSLYTTLLKAYDINLECNILACPTKRNKTIYDYNVNMLRTTTECMSAILGGANVVYNLAYDAIYHKDNEFGERIARNQLLILKEESYLNKVNNPTEGAYYIEEITNQLAEKSLRLFKEIETTGGFLVALKTQKIQTKIKEIELQERKEVTEQKQFLVGTNCYENANDRMKDDLELYPFLKTDQRKTLIEPILAKRLAEDIEKKRLDNE